MCYINDVPEKLAATFCFISKGIKLFLNSPLHRFKKPGRQAFLTAAVFINTIDLTHLFSRV